MLATFGKDDAKLQALERIRHWTRERFGLGADAPVFAAEVACALPGCPPLETVIGFWSDESTRHHFKVFKRAEEVTQDDLPPSWLRDALVVTPGAECSC
ncbi:MAG TPA: hypothetical protein VFC24_18910 [Casimicrobiaceae bacterium]|nr:hypothetical protein [Casimicrobiaceae bacterium]